MTATITPSIKVRSKEVIADLVKTHGIANAMAAPKITKVTLSMGVGRAIADGQILNTLTDHLSRIAGQKAVMTLAKKSISNFRLREGMKIGCMATLRGDKMWGFLDRLIHIAIPRIRDFRGISPKGFDKQGNFNLGLKEQALFPEVTLEKLDHNQGLNIAIVIANSTPELSAELLRGIGMPLRER